MLVQALTKEAPGEALPAGLALRAGAVVVPLPRASADPRMLRLAGPAERPSLVSPDRDRPFAAAALTLLAHLAVLLAWAYAPSADLPQPWQQGLVATIAFDPAPPAAPEPVAAADEAAAPAEPAPARAAEAAQAPLPEPEPVGEPDPPVETAALPSEPLPPPIEPIALPEPAPQPVAPEPPPAAAEAAPAAEPPPVPSAKPRPKPVRTAKPAAAAPGAPAPALPARDAPADVAAPGGPSTVALAPPPALPEPPVAARPVANVASNRKPDYPAEARRRRWQGEVMLRVAVAPDGLPETVEVVATSGHPLLDDAAVAAVRRWRFDPARRAGIPVRGSAEVPIRFRLVDDD